VDPARRLGYGSPPFPVQEAGRQVCPVPVRRTVSIADGIVFGGDTFVVMAGPCAVESRDQLFASAEAVRAAGAGMLRGGAFKPRPSPNSFQGLGAAGLDLLRAAPARTGWPAVTHVLGPPD